MASKVTWMGLMVWKDGDMRLRLNRRRATVCILLLGFLWLWSRLPPYVQWPDLPGFSLSLTHLDQAHTIAALAVLGIAVVGIVKLLARR